MHRRPAVVFPSTINSQPSTTFAPGAEERSTGFFHLFAPRNFDPHCAARRRIEPHQAAHFQSSFYLTPSDLECGDPSPPSPGATCRAVPPRRRTSHSSRQVQKAEALDHRGGGSLLLTQVQVGKKIIGEQRGRPGGKANAGLDALSDGFCMKTKDKLSLSLPERGASPNSYPIQAAGQVPPP